MMTWVFTSEVGTPLQDVNIVRRHFKPILKAAGLDEGFRFHDLRHTCASFMIHKNVSPKKIQRQMRHASIQMTFDTCGHLFEDESGGIGTMMDDLISGGKAVQLKTA